VTEESRIKGGKTLVVGGAGFVGSNLVKQLLDLGASEVLVVDNLLSAERENLPDDERVSFVEGSIADDKVLADLPTDREWVWHLATYHGNQSSIEDPIADHDNNLITTLKLYERLKDFDSLSKVVYSGSGGTVAPKTFDEASATDEDQPISLHLDSPYQISKIAGEFYSAYYHSREGLPISWVRFQNVYGPGEVLGAGRWRGTNTVWRNVTPTFVYKALKHEELPLQNGGVATRDFIFVEDICRGLIATAEDGTPGDVYNLASGDQVTIKDHAELINELAGNPTPISIEPAREWDHSGKRFGDPSKAREQIGFEVQVPWREGLERTVEWSRENLDWIESCIERHRDRLAELEGRTDPGLAPAR
jgi:nucleoside-diphosphate-sugar epimerase